MQAAIETIAEVGYARASYARIAEHAGLSSTGLISYYFASKGELVGEVVAEVVAAGQAFMVPVIEAAAPGRARLRAYIESNLAFMAGHRAQITAAAEVLNALPRHSDGQAAAYAPLHARGLEQLAGYLREGQAIGQLRRFAPDVMAQTIRAAIDAVGYRLAGEPGLDLAAWACELADLFDHAAGVGPPGSG